MRVISPTWSDVLDLSVIVPCHNEASTLTDQLDALTSQEWSGRWEIVVVDNNSTDATAAIAAAHAGGAVPVRIVDARDSAGVSYARNAGAATSTARSVAFCDGDDIVEPGWVAAIGSALEHEALVVGRIDVTRLNPAWLADTRPMGAAAGAPHFGRIPFASGGNCGIRRSLYEELGGFREDFVGLEDIEFSLRAAALGVCPHSAPDAVLSYRLRLDLRDIWKQGLFYGRGQVPLRRMARRLGLPGPNAVASLKTWAWLVVRLPRLRSRRGRRAWVWALANRVGALLGRFRRQA